MLSSEKYQIRLNSLKEQLIDASQAIPGRDGYPFDIDLPHEVLAGSLAELEHYPHKITLGLGCFWGAERLFWQQPGVLLTAAGYAGGYTPFPRYEEVCSGLTGHSEVVAIAYDPEQLSLEQLLQLFWENHDPTQGMRQGNDQGTQYRSAIYCQNEQDYHQAFQSMQQFQSQLTQAGHGDITTDLRLETVFYFAEPYHQQYLDKNPGGYCGLKGTGVTCI
ncbi:peptide-methionine (S)-S-oxide reductase MsrA [Oceanospirillum linum]|uniref:peptide-methionine (S)-S-oxide reductase MsrA n=1 Tax=Oceanospirillum linum TaxID=966 RepID=UPI00089E6B5E|nr:peptide-methionine (S)-S-oxide reductase MsrA [Oceanospirillum linum]SEG22465.1 peptide-methionine (S)-S-oxide reductase [Oleiphilus messinensis]SMP25313.1 peptide-methionine (S)-S-oxide reductase [Oceanospirillum linum]